MGKKNSAKQARSKRENVEFPEQEASGQLGPWGIFKHLFTGPSVEDRLRAMDLVSVAQVTGDDGDRRRLLQSALDIWPDCFEPHLMLAEIADDIEDASKQAAEALRIAEGLLKSAGLFPPPADVTRTLPGATYARALAAMAGILFADGQREKAVEACRELIRIDPDDLHRARDLLASSLLADGKLAELDELLKRFSQDRTGTWLFIRALLDFKRQGDSWMARKALGRARARNRHIAELLLQVGENRLQELESEEITEKELEAEMYALDFGSAWVTTPGAIDWLNKH
jgi:tetratricopeptide (TPR) repeat protein